MVEVTKLMSLMVELSLGIGQFCLGGGQIVFRSCVNYLEWSGQLLSVDCRELLICFLIVHFSFPLCRKPLGLDQKLENRLTMKDLERLKSSFMVNSFYHTLLPLNIDTQIPAFSYIGRNQYRYTEANRGMYSSCTASELQMHRLVLLQTSGN